MNQKIIILLVSILFAISIQCQDNIFDRVVADQGHTYNNLTKRSGSCASYQNDCGTYCCSLGSSCQQGGCCPTGSTACSDSIGKCCPIGSSCIPNTDKCRYFTSSGGSSSSGSGSSGSGSNSSKSSAASTESSFTKGLVLSTLVLLIASVMYNF